MGGQRFVGTIIYCAGSKTDLRYGNTRFNRHHNFASRIPPEGWGTEKMKMDSRFRGKDVLWGVLLQGQTRRLPPTNTVGFFARSFTGVIYGRRRGCTSRYDFNPTRGRVGHQTVDVAKLYFTIRAIELGFRQLDGTAACLQRLI